MHVRVCNGDVHVHVGRYSVGRCKPRLLDTSAICNVVS